MNAKPTNVLFLCTGNSARSILAEAILARVGDWRFCAYSAGSHPKGAVHPQALALLRRLGHDTAGLRSKSWDEFARPGAPALDFIITVCDNAAGEICPIWPGHPTSAHWGLPDPAAARPDVVEAAFAATYRALEQRIAAFVALPFATLEAAALRRRLRDIGLIDAAAQA